MKDKQGLPGLVRAMVLAVVAGGAVGVALHAGDIGGWTGADLVALLALVAGTVLTELFPIPLRHRTETLYFTLTDASWTAALLLGRPSVLVVGAALGIAVGLVVHRRPVHKVAFNVGQNVVAISVAAAVFGLFGTTDPFAPGAWAAAATAMSAYAVVSAGLVAMAIALVERKPFRAVLLPPLAVNALHYAGNIALGILLALAWTVSPYGLLLLVVPLALAYIAYRALVQHLRVGERIRSLILSHSSDGVFLVSGDGTVLSWNRAMSRITGFSEEEATGRTLGDVLGSPELMAEEQENTPEASIEDGRAKDLLILAKDGTRRWVSVSCNSIPKRRGGVEAKVVVARDVTAEMDARQLKSDFVTLVSHELRTPLTPLKGFLSGLAHGTILDDSPESRQEYYGIMLRQANRLETLLVDLLEASRLRVEQAPLDTRPFELNSLINGELDELGAQYPERTVTFEAEAPRLFVNGDPAALKRALAALISNAMKFSPMGSPAEVSVGQVNGHAVVSVRDHGVGIPLAEQERIFDRFERLDTTDTRSTGGAGLGLYISKRLVEAMGGKVMVHSIPGDGSTFSLSLPIAGAELYGSEN